MKVEILSVKFLKNFINHLSDVDRDFKTMEFEPSERSPDIKIYKQYLKNKFLKTYLLTVEEKIVGHMTIDLNKRRRMRHVAQISCAVKKGFHSKGIGQKLLSYCLNEIVAMKIKKVEATTLKDNLSVRHVLEKFGFKKEGRKRQSFCVDGEYKDEVIYGLLIQDHSII